MQQYSPKARVRIWTQAGEQIDLSSEHLLHLSTSSGIGAATGRWEADLSGVRVHGNSFADRIAPMDYIELTASRIPSAGGNLTTVMRGFVDNSQESRDPTTRRVAINGRDFGKVLLNYEIYNRPEMDPVAALLAGSRLQTAFQIPAGQTSYSDFVQLVLDNVLTPNLRNAQTRIAQVPVLRAVVEMPRWAAVNTLALQSFLGSVYNLLIGQADQPFVEVFITEDDAGPVLRYRFAPYTDANGTPISRYSALPPTHTIRDTDILSAQYGRSDNEVKSYYFTWPLYSLLDRVSFKAAGVDLLNGNPYLDTDALERYGFKPLDVQAVMLPSLGAEPIASSVAAQPEIIARAAELNRWLVAAYRDNAQFLNGSITVAGGAGIRPGHYIRLVDRQLEFYVSQVDHTFDLTVDPAFVTTLGIVRGRSYEQAP